jgi:hypothetical protein
VTAVALAGCGVATQTKSDPTVTTTSTRTTRPHPVKTVVRNYRTYRAGQTGILNSPQQHASLHVAVSAPSVATTSLSKSYGYPPANGHYVTFRLTITNTGRVPVLIRRLDFWVQTPGAARTTTDEGNAPYSGSGTQLDTTQLNPGDRVSNNLTFDVTHPTGTLFYGPGGHRALAWTF